VVIIAGGRIEHRLTKWPCFQAGVLSGRRRLLPLRAERSDPWVVVEAENGDKVTTKLVALTILKTLPPPFVSENIFDVDAGAANEAVAAYEPGNMRSQIVKKGTNTIILDAYNANPALWKPQSKTLQEWSIREKL